MTAQDLVNAGFTGYQGWDDAGAAANFAATGGEGKGTANGGGGGGYSPVSAPDLANLRTQVQGALSPYYEELAKQAKGDFNLAVQMMTADYQQGTRQAKETLAYQQKYGTGELQNALSTLGVNFTGENNKQSNDLNTRGMAVYQNSADGTPNVVQPATFNPTYDASNYTYNAGVSAPNSNMANLGRGGTEAELLRQDQQLRAEATMCAGMKPLEQAGISYKQYTNPNSGFDINNPATSTQGADLSQLGTSELGALKSYNTNTQNYRDTSQNLANQEANQVNTLANQYGSLGVKSLDANATNQLQKQYNANFVQSGVA